MNKMSDKYFRRGDSELEAWTDPELKTQTVMWECTHPCYSSPTQFLCLCTVTSLFTASELLNCPGNCVATKRLDVQVPQTQVFVKIQGSALLILHWGTILTNPC